MRTLLVPGVVSALVVVTVGAQAQDASFNFEFDTTDFGMVDIFNSSGDLQVKYTAPSSAVASETGGQSRATRFAFQLADSATGALSSSDPGDGVFTDDINDLFFGVDNSTTGFPTPQVGGPITIDFAASGTDTGSPGIPLDGTEAMDRFFVSSTTDTLTASVVEKVGVRFQGLDENINEGSLFLVDEQTAGSPSS